MKTMVTGATGCVVVVILDAERARRQQLKTPKMTMEIPTNPPSDLPTVARITGKE